MGESYSAAHQAANPSESFPGERSLSGHDSPMPLTVSWPNWFALMAGGVLAFEGTTHLLMAVRDSRVLTLLEPLLGVQVRNSLLLIGISELVVAVFCFFAQSRALSLGLLAWLTTNFMVYRIGLWTLHWPHPWMFVSPLTNSLGISPVTADRIGWACNLALCCGSITILWFDHQKKLAAGFQKMSCSACGGHIQFSQENLGQNISCPHCGESVTLVKPGILKMSCFFCKENIEFPDYARGTKIACPHCNMNITLKKAI